jgi:uncharacterized repeat protein (TIGR01451 family)
MPVNIFDATGALVRTGVAYNDGTHGDAVAGDALWTNDGSVGGDKINVPPGASGTGWVLRVYARDASTSTIGAQNGLVRGPGTGAAAETEANYWNIDEYYFAISSGAMTVTKTSSIVSDPFNGTTNPKRIPGAVVSYCVVIENTSNGTISSIVATDALPTQVSYIAGSLRSGTDCGSATTIEDDNSTGADESDPIGAAFTAGTVTGAAASLAKNRTIALVYRANVQ